MADILNRTDLFACAIRQLCLDEQPKLAEQSHKGEYMVFLPDGSVRYFSTQNAAHEFLADDTAGNDCYGGRVGDQVAFEVAEEASPKTCELQSAEPTPGCPDAVLVNELVSECDTNIAQFSHVAALRDAIRQRDKLQTQLETAEKEADDYELVGSLGEQMDDLKLKIAENPLSEEDYFALPDKHEELVLKVASTCAELSKKKAYTLVKQLGVKLNALKGLDKANLPLSTQQLRDLQDRFPLLHFTCDGDEVSCIVKCRVRPMRADLPRERAFSVGRLADNFDEDTVYRLTALQHFLNNEPALIHEGHSDKLAVTTPDMTILLADTWAEAWEIRDAREDSARCNINVVNEYKNAD
jgi:hypothetical protein